MDDKDKLRVHYQSLKNKKSTLYKTTQDKFKAPPKSSKEDIVRLRQQHAQKLETKRREKETAITYIKQIESREVLSRSEDKHSEEDIRKNMYEKGNERREARD